LQSTTRVSVGGKLNHDLLSELMLAIKHTFIHE